jgi:ABC-2 type transport system permease protein
MFPKLLSAQLKMLIRNRGALIGAIIFPVFFAGLLGAASRITEGETKLAVVNEGGDSGGLFVQGMRETKSFEITELKSRRALEPAFEKRKLDGALVVPPISGDKAEVLFIFDEQNATQFGRTQERVRSFVERYNLELAGGSEVITLSISPLRTTRTRSIFQYNLPGIIMFSVIFSALSFGGAQAIKYRENGVFKRLMVTPASARHFFVSEAMTRAMLAMGQTTLVLAVGLIIERELPPATTLWLFPLAVMGVMVFVSLGFVVAGISGNPDAVSGVTNLVGMALVLVSGGLLQTLFPPQVKQAVAFLPVQPMVNSMLGVVTTRTSPIESAPGETAILAAWVIGTFVLALMFFRFRAPSKR